MKAIQYTSYGNTDVLQQNDIEKPQNLVSDGGLNGKVVLAVN
jgi:hypothetical protein